MLSTGVVYIPVPIMHMQSESLLCNALGLQNVLTSNSLVSNRRLSVCEPQKKNSEVRAQRADRVIKHVIVEKRNKLIQKALQQKDPRKA